LAEQYGDELRPAGKAFGVTLGGVFMSARISLGESAEAVD
jgi:hypothetical protein